ncbi:MAG: hypothetical protein ABIP74_01740 [Candidatus Saccharimonas sp.]
MPRISGEHYLTREENFQRRHMIDTQLARVATAWVAAWNAPELRLLDATHKTDATKDIAQQYRGFERARADLDL